MSTSATPPQIIDAATTLAYGIRTALQRVTNDSVDLTEQNVHALAAELRGMQSLFSADVVQVQVEDEYLALRRLLARPRPQSADQPVAGAMSEQDASLVLRATAKLHDIECGCPHSGEHTWADIERREQIARAVLAVADQSIGGAS